MQETIITTSPFPTSPNMNPKKSGYVTSQRTVGSTSSLFGTPNPRVSFSNMLRTGILGFCNRVGAFLLAQSLTMTSSAQIFFNSDLIMPTLEDGTHPSIM